MHLTFLFLALCSVVPAYSNKENAYKNGYYLGRSADVVIDEVTNPAEIQLPWQLTHKQHNVVNVRDVHVYNLVSRALGLPQVHLPSAHTLDTELDDVVPFNFFSSPSGNMLFSIEGLSSATIPSTTQTLGKTPTYTLHQSSAPYHPLSLLTTVTTGTIPKRHGVVNEADLTSFVPNFDDIARGLNDDSIIVTGSSCGKFADVLASHEGAESYSWDCELGAFTTLNKATPTVVVSKDNLASHLAALPLPITYLAGVESRIGDVTFDINDEVDDTLFAEIAFVAAWGSHLRQIEDSRKFFSFHFTALVDLATKYGTDSKQWNAAVEAIDAAIQFSLSEDCTFEVIYLPTYHNERSQALKARLAPVFSSFVAQDLFPQVYLTSEGVAQQAELCARVVASLSTDFSDVTVFCPLNVGSEKRAVLDDEPKNLAPVTADIPTVLQFHYVFWTMMVIIAALSWATYAIATIEPDQTLYTASTFYKKGAGK